MEALYVHTSTLRTVQKHRICTQRRSRSIVQAYFHLTHRAKALTLHAMSYWMHCVRTLSPYAQCKSIDSARNVETEAYFIFRHIVQKHRLCTQRRRGSTWLAYFFLNADAPQQRKPRAGNKILLYLMTKVNTDSTSGALQGSKSI